MSTTNLVAKDVPNNRFFVLAKDEHKAKAVLKKHPEIDNVDRLEFRELDGGAPVHSESTGTHGATSAKAGATGAKSAVMQIGQFEVKTHGVLNTGLGEKDNVPGNHVIVDPAGEIYIKEGPVHKNGNSAGGLSGVIYRFLDIYQEDYKFDEEVKTAIKNKRAAYHKYDKASVIHVVGPDFSKNENVTYGDAIEKLSRAYASVFDVAEELAGCNVVRLPLISGGIFSGKFGHDASDENKCVPELTARAIFAALSDRKRVLQKRYWTCTNGEGENANRMMRALQWAKRTKYVEYDGASGGLAGKVEYEEATDGHENKHKMMLHLSKGAVLLCVSIVSKGRLYKIGGKLCSYQNGIPRFESENQHDTQNRPEENTVAAWMLGEPAKTSVLRSTVGGHDIKEGECVVVEHVELCYGTNDGDGEFKIDITQTAKTKAIAFIASSKDKDTMEKNVLAGLSAAATYKTKVVIAVDSDDISPLRRNDFTSLVKDAANTIGAGLEITILGPID
jgi:hypothetical protein